MIPLIRPSSYIGFAVTVKQAEEIYQLYKQDNCYLEEGSEDLRAFYVFYNLM